MPKIPYTEEQWSREQRADPVTANDGDITWIMLGLAVAALMFGLFNAAHRLALNDLGRRCIGRWHFDDYFCFAVEHRNCAESREPAVETSSDTSK